MDTTFYKAALALVAVAVIINQGKGNRMHYGIQLYLLMLVLFVAWVAFGEMT